MILGYWSKLYLDEKTGETNNSIYNFGCIPATFWESIAEDYAAIGPPTGFQGTNNYLRTCFSRMYRVGLEDYLLSHIRFFKQVLYLGSSFQQSVPGCISMFRWCNHYWIEFQKNGCIYIPPVSPRCNIELNYCFSYLMICRESICT